MIIFFSLLIAVVAIVAMLFIYYCAFRVLKGQFLALQDELAEAREQVLAVLPELDNGMAATWGVDRDKLEMTFHGDYAERMGFSKSFWTVPEFRQICNQDCLDVFEKWIGHYNSLTDPICRRLRFHLTTDGGKTYHWWELIYVLDEQTSKEKSMCGLFVNIDQLIDIESAIDDARNKLYQTELKQTFVASINHDLRTPINAIAGFAGLLVEQYDDLTEEDRLSFAEIVQSNSDILLQLLSDISDMSGNDIEKIRFKPRKKSVHDLIDVVYRTNMVICPSHLKFILDVDDSCEDKEIFVDVKRIEQVINNFLSNSFKFTQAGFVKVGWRYLSETDEVELFVEDSGIGIKKENINKLFQQYFKIHEHAHGTGLGLNICKVIVERQNGTVGVESTYGKGSKFYCRFKVAQP